MVEYFPASMSLRFHTILSLGALALILSIAVQTVEKSPRLRAALTHGTVDIGIEHSNPLSVRFEYVTKDGAAIVRIAHSSDEIVSISVPEDWKRGEVSGALLKKVRKDEPIFGFVRWHFPAHTSIAFSIRKAPEHIVIHNPSMASLKLTTSNVNLLDGTVEKNVLLVQDSAVKIW